MQQIYIENLKIEDFGPFYGAHCFDFSAAEDRRAVLIGGKNGAGKTHLLRALYLAVVGEIGAGDLKKVEAGSEATKFNLRESLNRRAQSEGRTASKFEVSLSLRDETGSIGRHLILFREIRHRINSPPTFHAKAYIPDDNRFIEDDQDIQKLRETFMPRHLTRFFFFDAERSQSLKLNEQEIVEGISRILGLYSYTELENELNKLIRLKIPARYGKDSDKERLLNQLLAEKHRDEENIKTYRLEIEEKKRDLRDIQEELDEVEEQLRSIGAVDPDELSRLNKQRDAIKDNRSRLENDLKNAWETALPVALLGAFRQQLHSALQKEERRRDWENRKASVEPKIPKIKKEVFDSPPEEHVLTMSSIEFYKNRLEEALKGLFHPPEEGIAESVFIVPERNELSIKIREQLNSKPAALANLAALTLDLDRKTSELRETDQRLSQFQDKEAQERGRELHEKRGKLNSQKEVIEKDLQEIEAKISSLKNEHTARETKISTLTNEVANLRQGRHLNDLAHLYREAAAQIKSKASVQLREKISHIVGDLWLDITERALEYRAMKFDKNWDCSLMKADGTSLLWDSANTSAGQRQVRILAFTEALRRLAKFVPPLVVDTPLGRLDREIKENVLTQLYLSGHQSVILTTNSEIPPDSQLFQNITSKLARVYTLNPEGDEESQSYQVRVSEDYFKHVL
ncbi:MAG: AAA family ATPase [Candidatus Electronema sp. VV]